MQCPFCKADDDKVIDSRAAGGGSVIRRRRQCLTCQRRYTTYERVEEMPLRVVKKDGRRVPFDRQRILQGMLKACEKRPIAFDQLEEITDRIEAQVNDMFEREVGSKIIGHMVMKELHRLDAVAYVRFASVYREFKDVHDFVDEVKPLLEGRRFETTRGVEDAAALSRAERPVEDRS
ncbi:MAG: transcriptional regulator NrdR [Planctomycetes bacterium]|nr:transcriptional regulator NrdR [Planctomycetota bacterium]